MLHVGDLDRSSTSVNVNKWRATVTVTVHDQGDAIAPNATVAFRWSGGATGSCITTSTGKCSASTTKNKSASSVGFTVTNVTASGASYDSTANHDPDGDSNGTSITVNKPLV